MSPDTLADRFGLRLIESPQSGPQYSAALRVLAAALDAVDPRAAVGRHVRRDNNTLRVAEQSFDLTQISRIVVVGAGKAGGPMALGIEDLLGDRLTDGWVNVKSGHLAPTKSVHLHEAGHPIPNEASVAGTREIVRRVSGLTDRDLVICLISGGGSALMTLPRPPLTLAELQTTTDLLLRAGADINELNTVRKHLDLVKGGGLAQFAAPAKVITLVLSDVIGDPIDVIASGPTVSDPTTFADAAVVTDRYDLWSRLPKPVSELLERGMNGLEEDTPKTARPTAPVIIGSNAQTVSAAIQEASRQGWNTLDLGSMIQGEAREVGRVLAGLAQSVAASGRPIPAPACLIAGGETVVTVRGQGRGGRNQELALGAALAIQDLPDTLIVSLGTDGTDGPTDAAGAIADGQTIKRALQAGADPHRALQENASYSFFEAIGALLITGPTRTNVNDLMCVFVGKP